jgi:hypothetical protein
MAQKGARATMADSEAPASMQVDAGRKDAVVVLGMHRSGTSALSRFLTELGFAQALNVMPPQADNPLGFWEPVDIVRFNERLLKSFGSGWLDASAFWIDDGSTARASARIPAELVEDHIAEASGLLLASYEGLARICIKDPRLPLLSDLWTQALDRAGFRTHFVFIYRNPLEVVGSLRSRNALEMNTCLRLFLKHMVAILQALLPAGHVATVDFARLRSDPAAEACRLIEHFSGGGAELGSPDPGELSRLVSEDNVHVRAPHGALDRLPRSPLTDLVRETDRLVRRYLASGHLPATAVELLNEDFLKYCLHNGHINLVCRPPQSESAAKPASPARAADPPRRKIIMHYHLFKNAGTSVDAVLKRNYGERWVSREFAAANLERNKADMMQWIFQTPAAVAFSSHTSLAVVRRIEDVELFPVVFIRHPLERIRSAYLFERQQAVDTTGARLARQMDFAGYVRARLDQPGDHAIGDFQARRLASWPNATNRLALLNAAMAAAESLPFIGLVDRFDDSMDRLRDWLLPDFPEFKVFSVRRNVSRPDTSLEDAIEDIRMQLGPALFGRLVEENRVDQAVYEAVSESYQASRDGL